MFDTKKTNDQHVQLVPGMQGRPYNLCCGRTCVSNVQVALCVKGHVCRLVQATCQDRGKGGSAAGHGQVLDYAVCSNRVGFSQCTMLNQAVHCHDEKLALPLPL
jgi:hypothetical protein